MFEHRSKKVLPFPLFLFRLLKFGLYTGLLLVICLVIGVVGYHAFSKMSWLDALLNASMILTGMGPMDHPGNSSEKWFASFYAIFSGVAFPSLVAIFLSPFFHRIMHKLHVSRGPSSHGNGSGSHHGDR
jgi:hypothetical protein